MIPPLIRAPLASLLRIVIGAYVALFLLLLGLRLTGRIEQMFFYPDRLVYGSPADLGLPYEDVRFASRDGTPLTGWFVPAVGPPVGTIIHFHGNAQNMTSHFSFVDWLPARGFNVFVFDYRGYGRSGGRPSLQGVYEDSLAALDAVLSRADIDPDRVAALGQSLGGAMVLAALGREGTRGLRAVVADSAYESHRGIVSDTIRNTLLLAPFRGPLSRMLLPEGLDAADVVDRIAPTPLLLIHGTADRVIPAHHSRRLYERAGEPKELWLAPGLDHTEAIADPAGPWRDRLVEFLVDAFDGAGPASGRPDSSARCEAVSR